jgi:hypothetical protein
MDSTLCELLRQGAREGDDGALGGGVVKKMGVAAAAVTEVLLMRQPPRSEWNQMSEKEIQ